MSATENSQTDPGDSSDSDLGVRLKQSLTLNDLVSDEGTVFEVNFDDLDDEPEQLSYDPKDLFDHTNPAACGLVDEDIYQDGEPFENMATRMTNVIEDGKIKKRILREGYGSILPDKSTVTVDYNAYMEYNDDPFDSTYIRRRPFTFRLNDGQTLPGLDLAVQSMKLNEKSQFLVDSMYAYGQFGCMERVPPNSTILFEIEVKHTVDSGACITYPNLTEEKQKDFLEIYKYALALCSKAGDLFRKGLYKLAIKEYNIAVSKLENTTLRDYNDQEKQQELLFRLHSNLVVALTKQKEYRRACTIYNKMCRMCKGTSLKIPAKVYFNNGRCLLEIGDYRSAEIQLKKAQRLEPQNKTISEEFIRLNLKKKEAYEREVAMAKAAFKNDKNSKLKVVQPGEISQEFKESMTDYFDAINKDTTCTQYRLLEKLTKEEFSYVENEVVKHGLELKLVKQGDVEKYFIAKKTN